MRAAGAGEPDHFEGGALAELDDLGGLAGGAGGLGHRNVLSFGFPEGPGRLLPVLPSGAVGKNRRKDGRFRVRGGRIERSGFARKQGFQPSRSARARFAEIGGPGRNAAHSGLEATGRRFTSATNPTGGPAVGTMKPKPIGKDAR
jgi:hypothetical protein